MQGSKYRHFCSEWFQEYPWLVLCTTKLKAYCYQCRYCTEKGLLLDKFGDKAFVHMGFDNWKKAKERFKQHEKSSSHLESASKLR